MDQQPTGVHGPRKFQVKIGNEIAYVEIISVKDQICAVEIPGHEPVFITKVCDQNNKSCWISIPQGNNDLAASIGTHIEEQLNQK